MTFHWERELSISSLCRNRRHCASWKIAGLCVSPYQCSAEYSLCVRYFWHEFRLPAQFRKQKNIKTSEPSQTDASTFGGSFCAYPFFSTVRQYVSFLFFSGDQVSESFREVGLVWHGQINGWAEGIRSSESTTTLDHRFSTGYLLV